MVYIQPNNSKRVHTISFYDPETDHVQYVQIVASAFQVDAIVQSRTAVISLLKSTSVQQSSPLTTYNQGVLEGIITTINDYQNLLKCYYSNIHNIPYNKLFPTHFYPLKQEYFYIETPESVQYQCTFRSSIEVLPIKDQKTLCWSVVIPFYMKKESEEM